MACRVGPRVLLAASAWRRSISALASAACADAGFFALGPLKRHRVMCGPSATEDAERFERDRAVMSRVAWVVVGAGLLLFCLRFRRAGSPAAISAPPN